MNWSYGVTTCFDRVRGPLLETARSLREAGFDRPRLFADGCRENGVPESLAGLPVTCRNPAVQVAANLFLSLQELYLRDPHADRYALFQDDCLAVRGLRGYLDRCEYPARGYWNLYTCGENAKLCKPGYRGWYQSNQLGKGAVGLVFDRQSLLTLLSCPELLERFQNERKGHKSVDGAVVHVLTKAGYKEHVHSPSLMEHTGDVSVQNPQRHPSRKMRSGNWLGEDADLLSIISPS